MYRRMMTGKYIVEVATSDYKLDGWQKKTVERQDQRKIIEHQN